MKNVLIVLLVLWMPFQVFGQTTSPISSEISDQSDTTVCGLPSLSEQYFEDAYSLDRNYEYQLLNKKKRLQMWAINTVSIATAILVGGIFLSVELITRYNWKEGVAVPCCVIIAMLPVLAGVILMRYLLKRAAAIDVKSLTHIPLNNRMSLGFGAMACQHQSSCTNYQSIGLGITLNF